MKQQNNNNSHWTWAKSRSPGLDYRWAVQELQPGSASLNVNPPMERSPVTSAQQKHTNVTMHVERAIYRAINIDRQVHCWHANSRLLMTQTRLTSHSSRRTSHAHLHIYVGYTFDTRNHDYWLNFGKINCTSFGAGLDFLAHSLRRPRWTSWQTDDLLQIHCHIQSGNFVKVM